MYYIIRLIYQGFIKVEITSQYYCVYFESDGFSFDKKKVFHYLISLLSFLDREQLQLFNYQFERIEFDISLVDKNLMTDLNKTHRNKDRPTDVLSFPQEENVRNGDFESILKTLHLGDIIICHDLCKDQAIENNLSYEEELIHLIVHGLLHLYGFDHELSEKEEALMENLEERILKAISSK